MTSRWNRMILPAAAMAGLLACASCSAPDSEAGAPAQRERAVANARAILPSQLKDLALGKTSVADIEQRFGEPDERAIDGAMTYRWEMVRLPDQTLGVRKVDATLEPGERLVRKESVTFRFADGLLSKICQERS
jgi:hypothetical protein